MFKHWTERLFIENPFLFQATIEERFKKADVEVDSLITLFDENKVSKTGRILDLACGIGRISIPLAKKGYKVTGIDISEPYIKKSIEYAKEEGVLENTCFLVGDIRKVASILDKHVECFDAVISVWTSMGYWDEEMDKNILRQSLVLSKPKSVFIMHTINRDGLIKRFQERDIVYSKDDLVIIQERRFSLEDSRIINYWSYYQKIGEDLRFLDKLEIDHRVYSIHELKKLFQDSGWTYISSYGGFNLKQLTIGTSSLIIVAEKPYYKRNNGY